MPSICNPADPPHTGLRARSRRRRPRPAPQQSAPTPKQQKQIQNILKGVDPNKVTDDTKKKLQDLLPGVKLPDLPQLQQLPQLPDLTQGLGLNASAPSGSTTQDLLNFLLGQ